MLVDYRSRLVAYTGVLFSLFASYYAEASITPPSSASAPFSAQVYLDNQPTPWQLQAEDPVRLGSVVLSALEQLSPSLSTLNIDWQQARLHRRDKTHTIASQQLSQLKAAEDQVAPSQREAWRHLQQQLQQQSFADRVLVNLDPDMIRVVDGHNPLLSGEYSLYLSSIKNNDSVMVWGAVSTSGFLPWQADFTAKQYAITNGWLAPYLSHVIVIQPNGDIEQHPVGYWLESATQQVQPGAIIYVPFTSTLFSALTTSQLKELNLWVINTLRHRLPTHHF